MFFRLFLSLLFLLMFISCRTVYKPDVKVMGELPDSPAVVVIASCNSPEGKCKQSFSSSVNTIVKNNLEKKGFDVIIPKGNNLNFESLSVEDKRAVLKKYGANGAVTSTIDMLPKENSENWIVDVHIRYKDYDNDSIVWVTSCKHESFWNEKNSWSIEEATKCALKGLYENKNTKKISDTVEKREDYPVMLKVQGKVKLSNDFREGVEEILTLKKYSLIDEKTQNEALEQQKEQSQSDCYDDSCLVDTGKMLAARGLIIVNIEKKSENSYKFNAKFIDFEKGTTVKSVTRYFEFSLDNYKELMMFAKSLIKVLLKK